MGLNGWIPVGGQVDPSSTYSEFIAANEVSHRVSFSLTFLYISAVLYQIFQIINRL
jgi:hypothetical protein